MPSPLHSLNSIPAEQMQELTQSSEADKFSLDHIRNHQLPLAMARHLAYAYLAGQDAGHKKVMAIYAEVFGHRGTR